MGMDIHVRSVGMERLKQKLKATEEGIADMKPFWRSVGGYLVTQSARNFEKECSPEGTKWQKWSEQYKAHMKKIGKAGNKILQNVGTLRGNVKYLAFRDRVFIGSNEPYARRHQLGDVGWKKGVRGGIPPRPFLGVTDQDRMEILRMMRIYFKRRVER